MVVKNGVDERENWDGVLRRLGRTPDNDRWLERWRDILETSRGTPILELGCGVGHDAGFLTRLGFGVVATDFSGEALEQTRCRAPDARLKNVDLTRGLPFPDADFRVIVASLSLHYFPWRQTLEILHEVRRCLRPGGHLLARFNSTNDPYYAAAEKEVIEENFYFVEGSPKRLFDRESVQSLFARDWQVVDARERKTGRYGYQKTLWEVVARKADG